jgi:hypothetical protein
MKNVMLVDFSELLAYSTELGYHWNQAHDILIKGLPITPEAYGLLNIEIDEMEELESEDTKKIVLGFMKDNRLYDFYLRLDK